MTDVLDGAKQKFHEVPESRTGKAWLFWISLLAMGLTAAQVTKQLRGGSR